MASSSPDPQPKRHLRWWPAAFVLLVGVGVIVWIRLHRDWSFQERNLATLGAAVCMVAALFLWWLVASRAPWRIRLLVAVLVAGAIGLIGLSFRIKGVSGDLLPILEPRWARPVALATSSPTNHVPAPRAKAAGTDFPQFLGPDRTAMLVGPALQRDWSAHPPQLMWRQAIGAAWSGWAIVGTSALTQEQRPEGECCTCYEAQTGKLLWMHADPAHYSTTIAGEGPRCTPTVVSNRVFALGAAGILNCLDLESGRLLWSHDIVRDAGSHVPEWGFAGSPLVFDEKVVVIAGGSPDRSLLAYNVGTGNLGWSGGSASTSYSSPFLATLAGVRQVLAFNSRRIASHDAATGKVLWEYPWGVGQPHVAIPLVIGTNRVVFSSGYGVGSEMLEINSNADGRLAATRVWQSRKLKAKFANLFALGGFLYGLDDGILACLDLQTGSQLWKEGRYGHGQGLLVRDLLLLMAENGELVLLQPTPEGPHELSRFRVFSSKTWNPIALAGDLLLVRNDQEAACLRLALEEPAR